MCLDEKQKNTKAGKLDANKAEQMQRLGMGWSGKRFILIRLWDLYRVELGVGFGMGFICVE